MASGSLWKSTGKVGKEVHQRDAVDLSSPMTIQLDGKTAIVTGAAAGIGRAIAERFSKAGAKVTCADIDHEGAAKTAGRIEHGGGSALAIGCDVSDSDDTARTVEQTVAEFGGLHVLVNCAAIWIPDGTVVEISESDWNRSFAVNLNGAFLMSKFAIPAMELAGGGSIIHIASQLGHAGKPGRTWYCTAKAALIHLARVMAIDHADRNIRVNALSPGPIATERIIRRYGGVEPAQEKSGSLTLFNRLGRPEEIADAALFLASDASSFMTGSEILVDGGYTAV